MPTWIITIAIPLLQQIIKAAPQLKTDLQAIFNKDEVTDEDWEALRQRIAGKTYEELVPHSALNGPVETP